MGCNDSPLALLDQRISHASTSYTLFKLVYGHSPQGLLDVICEGWEARLGTMTRPQAVVNFRERLEKAQEIAQENLSRRLKKQKHLYDAHAS